MPNELLVYFRLSLVDMGHANIIKYCNRPFKSLEHMNQTIIKNHNSRVKKEDTVFHLGDFCFRNSYNGKEGIRTMALEWEEQLNGKIVFIKGNHDKNNSLKTIIHNMAISFCNERVFCVHNPEHYNRTYPINLVGHVHEKWRVQKREGCILINVGVDVWDFMPHTLQEILLRRNMYEQVAKT